MRPGGDHSKERLLYADVVGVGLSGLLQVELDRRAVGLEASWDTPGAFWSRVERADRSAEVAAAEDERAFSVALWAEGVEYLTGWTGEISEVAAAICEWLSEALPGGEAMAATFSFLELNPFARSYERGEVIEDLWRNLLDSPPSESMRPLVEAAAAEPGLRRLRPYTSLDRLCFSRWVGWPFSEDLPQAAPHEGRFRVFRDARTMEQVVLGEGDAARAVELLVAALPEQVDVLYRRPPRR